MHEVCILQPNILMGQNALQDHIKEGRRREKDYYFHKASQNICKLSYMAYKYILFKAAKNYTRPSQHKIIKIMSLTSQNFSNLYRMLVLLRYCNLEDLKVSNITFIDS